MTAEIILGFALSIFILFIMYSVTVRIIRSLPVVPEGAVAVLTRNGRFLCVRGPGRIIMFPLLYAVHAMIPTSVQIFKSPRLKVLLNDGTLLELGMVLKYCLAHEPDAPYKAAFHVSDWKSAIEDSAMATLYHTAATHDLTGVLLTQLAINAELRANIQHQIEDWGFRVINARFVDIDVLTRGPIDARQTDARMPTQRSALRKPAEAIEIFLSYAHEDEDLRDELEKHLSILKRLGLITTWHDRKIGAGKEWKGEIDTHLNTAHVILLLISPDFVASEYCWGVEVQRAMERHDAGETRVVPTILRPVAWEDAPFGKLQALPTDAKPITTWESRDAAFLDIALGIRMIINELTANR
jgi:regulator of protease activity HflC (stomatin/prohibitin superfamily)